MKHKGNVIATKTQSHEGIFPSAKEYCHRVTEAQKWIQLLRAFAANLFCTSVAICENKSVLSVVIK